MNMKKKLKLKRYLSFLLAFIMLALNFISLPTNHNVNKVYAAPANNIVISEAYGGGGNKGAEYKNDFIELYNPTSEDIDISGWSVQYASATGSFTNSVTIESGTIMAGGYYLIQAIAGNGGTKDLPTPDLVCTIAMGASNFKVRITDSDSNVVDLVGAGSASEFEGTSAASAPSNTTSIQRKDNDNTENGITNGWDTDDNGKDFYTGPPTPRNSQSGAGEETVTDTVLESIESARLKIIGEEAKVQGVVTGLIGNNAFIQDETAGIYLYNGSTNISDLALGKKVEVTGTLDEYNKLKQLTNNLVVVVDGEVSLPTPIVSTLPLTADLESKLVTVQDLTIKSIPESATKGYSIEASDGINNIELRIDSYLEPFISPEGTGLSTGDKVTVTAPVGRYYDNYQLMIRSIEDITLVEKSVESGGEVEVPVEEKQIGNMLTSLETGDEVVIYNKADNLALSRSVSGSRLLGVSGTLDNGTLDTPEGATILRVTKDNNGYYTFTSDGKYLTSGPTGNSLSFTEEQNEYSLWVLEEASGGFLVKNLNAKYGSSSQYLEVYNEEFTTYGNTSTTDTKFIFNFYESISEETKYGYTIDDSVVLDIAGWAGSGDYSIILDNTVYGDLYKQNDMLDNSTKFTANVSGEKTAPYTTTKSGDITNYYMGGKGIGSGTDDYLQLELNSLGYGNIDLSFRLRASNTGPGSFQVQYSTDGTTYKNLSTGTYDYSYTAWNSEGSYPVENSGEIIDGIAKTSLAPGEYINFAFDLPKEAENAKTLYIRLVPGSEAAKSTSTLGSAGTLRMDTVKVTGSPIISDEVTAYVAALPKEGEVAINSELTLTTSTDDATIYYSTNNGATYDIYDNANKPLLTELPARITTYAQKDGLAKSIIRTYEYTQAQCNLVKATPNGGAVTNGSKVILRSQEEDATILFAQVSNKDIDDSSIDWDIYEEPITIMSFPTILKVKVVKDGYLDSQVSTFTFTERENEDYNIYFGQLHSHTNYSDGTGSVEEAFEHASNAEQIDFLAVTDHSNSLDNDLISEINRNVDTSIYDEWTQGHMIADRYTTDDFVAMFGYEMTWNNGLGHVNTFNTEGFQSRNQEQYKPYETGLQNYYETLKTAPASITQFNHPGTTFGDFKDFAYYDEEIDALITLIEVGNGEGEVGSSGYFTSYEYYTRALDKGWHLAPTNNQDNHKGLWGDANTARTVALADSNSRENIYDAMRNYRVYSSEDNNLSIYYTLDSYIMGSILEDDQVGETVEITVDINDEDLDDIIGEVEVIVNGGLTIASETVDDNEEIVTFEVPSSYSYYFIRITQEDGDIAVTAPIWVGDIDACGISKLYTDTSLPIQGGPIDVNLELFNNEDSDLIIESIDFIVNDKVVKSLTEDELVANNMAKVKASDTASYSFDYTHNSVGNVNIVATVTARSIDGSALAFSEPLSLSYVKADMVTNVLIDGSHYNDYVSGYYGGNMGNFIEVAANNNVKAVIETEEITKEMLDNTYLLIISAPAKKTGSANAGDYIPAHFSNEFISLVADYVANGGSVIISGLADYQDTTSGQTSVEINKLLEGIGSTLRIRSDELYDEVNNGGQEYRLYFTDFNKDSKYLAGIEEGQEFSMYSGCSVDTTNASENDIVYQATPLVYGHETTYSVNSKAADGSYLSAPWDPVLKKGEVVALAHQETKSGGNIFVGGTVFMSDFEIKAEMDNYGTLPYANLNIITNILNEIKVEIPISTIAEARTGEMGDVYAVEGYVTNGTSNENTTFFDAIYVQDQTAGITIHPYGEPGLEIGTKVKIIGYLDQYQGDIELKVHSVEKLDEKSKVIEPKKLSTKDAMDYETYGGSLIKTSGTVTRVDYTSDEQGVAEFWIKDESGKEAAIFIDGYITSATSGKNQLASIVKEGTHISAVGISFMHPEGDNNVPVLRVRNCDEIVAEEPNDAKDEENIYKINEGNRLSFTQGTNSDFTFTIDVDFTKFIGLKVDGKLVDKSNYDSKAGSTVITLKKDYLETLSPGEHTLTVVFTDGQADTTLDIEAKDFKPDDTKDLTNTDDTDNGKDNETVNKDDIDRNNGTVDKGYTDVTDNKTDTNKANTKNIESPKTGDNFNILFWITLAGFSLLGIVFLIFKTKRNYNRKR